ncbi:MAG: FAD-dependent oxidoreductase [Bacillota bacterium]
MKKRGLFGLISLLIILAVLVSGCFTDRNEHLLLPGEPPPVAGNPPGEYFDVIVVGGEPEGVAAAVAAARLGGRVLLVEKRFGLGGLMTFGMLNSIDMNYGPNGELLTQGVFAEFFKEVGGDSFDVEQAKNVFHRLVEKEQNITLLLNAKYESPVMSSDGTKILGVEVSQEGERRFYYAGRVIDATQDADVAASAGVPYTVGSEDIGVNWTMAQTLVFGVGGVDWSVIQATLSKDDDSMTGANRVSAWGFGKEMRNYQPSSPSLRMRGLNMGRQYDGTVLINALHIFGVDGLDEAAKEEAIELAKAELPRIVEFLRQNIPGFGNAYLALTAPELYIRQTRHIKGEYTLSILDVVENRDFPDRIAHGSYPVDIQSTSPKNTGFTIANPKKYSIPFRCLVPVKVDNLLVVGRSASFSSLAMGSARVIPVGMATGQAAGVASVYSLAKGMTPRELAYSPEDVEEVQKLLVKQGAYLRPFAIQNPWENHWGYPYLRALLPVGVIIGGYDNNWRLDEVMPEEAMVHIAMVVAERRAPGRVDRTALHRLVKKDVPLTETKALQVLMVLRGLDPNSIPPGQLKEHFKSQGWLSQEVFSRLPSNNEPLTRSMAYAMMVETFRQLGILPRE